MDSVRTKGPTPVAFLPIILPAALIFCLSLLLSVAAAAAGPLHLLVEVPLRGDSDVLRLTAGGFDVAGVNRAAGTAGVVVTEAELERLKSMGFSYALKDVGHPLRRRAEVLSDYTDPVELGAFIDQAQAAYPNLVKKVVLKDTLFEGQKLIAVKITSDVNEDHDRPVFLLDAQHHAREVMTVEIAKDAIGYLASNYGKDTKVTEWLDKIEVWVVACVNPDGAEYVFTTDNMWRKNRDPICPVDLNRNYGWNWNACGGSSGACSSEIYRGPSPESEPETQGVTALADEIRPLFSLSYHSYGEYLLYPYGCENPSEMAVYDDLGQTLNGILEDDNGERGRYKTGPGWSTIYETDGSSDDTLYGRYGAFAFVIEVNSSDFQPDYSQWRDVTVQRQRTAWQYFLDKTLTYPSIQGQVTDATTGQPLKATFTVQEAALTNGETPRRASARGRYGWPLQGGKTYHVTFSMPGYITQTREVAVGTGTALMDVQLTSTSQGAAPRDPAPQDKALNQDLAATLTWSSDGATGYEVYFGTTPTPPMAGTATTNSYSPSSLELGRTYYWQVVALGPWGKTAGPVWSFSTRPYAITGAKKAANPFRLLVSGAGFVSGCTLKVDGTAVATTQVKGSARLVGKGAGLKVLVPKGKTVQLVVGDGAGGASEPFPFSW